MGQALAYVVSAPEVSTQVDLPFHYRIVTEGGWVPDHFAAGPLPAGLALDPDRGELSGTPTEIGNFQIRLEATAAGITDDKATSVLSLHVTSLPNPPWFSGQPATVYTLRGGAASLQAVVEGSGPVRYQWFRVAFNGGGPEARTPIPTATEAVLKLKAVTEADAGFYQLQASNDTGSTFSAWGQLVIVAAPVARIRVGRTRMHAGGLIGIDTDVNYRPPIAAFQWRHNGVAIPSQTGTSLVLYPLATEDAGTYDLVMTNLAGTVISNAIQVTVADPVRPSLARHTGSSSLIRFTAIPGIQYTIESTSDAPDDSATWVQEDAVVPTTTSVSRLVVDKGSVRFYRIQGR
jgi:hypothetical protein